MKVDRFIESHSDALDRFIQEYQKHLRKEKDQFGFVEKKYLVSPDEISHINDNILRIRKVQETFESISLLDIDEIYKKKFSELADHLSIPLEGERIIDSITEAEEILRLFVENTGEWMHGCIKYFGLIDTLDGVHSYEGLLSFIHSSSQYKAIHMGVFSRMVILRPEKDMLFFIINYGTSHPFLKANEVCPANRFMDREKVQMIYSSFFGTKYHVRLFLKQGDSILLAPAYFTRKGYTTPLLEEHFLYAEG